LDQRPAEVLWDSLLLFKSEEGRQIGEKVQDVAFAVVVATAKLD
jgi:hypothetical protein